MFDTAGLLEVLLIFPFQLLDDLLAVIGLPHSEHLGAFCLQYRQCMEKKVAVYIINAKIGIASGQNGYVRTDQPVFLKTNLDYITLSAVTFSGRLS